MVRHLTASLLLACGFGLAFASEEIAAPRVGEARIYYFGFEIQRMTGIPEAQMAALGCVYSGDAGQLRHLLQTAPISKALYEPGNVRAKIVTAQGDWYVDANGIAKAGEQTVSIDKTAFVRLLSLDRDTPCPRRH